MRHDSVVTLTGEFRVINFDYVSRKGHKYLEVRATVQTGPESEGGMHRVFLISEPARLARAYVEANGGDGMLVTVLGTLYSIKGKSRVVVDSIAFHVPKHVEEKGKFILGQMIVSQNESEEI